MKKDGNERGRKECGSLNHHCEILRASISPTVAKQPLKQPLLRTLLSNVAHRREQTSRHEPHGRGRPRRRWTDDIKRWTGIHHCRLRST